ncbi:MAG: 4-(cytidine 5'-diphospho)-2-C-methyl-D-erythritol kinase [Thermoanaerobaculia bacterium]
MRNELTVRSFAKINWMLRVLDRRPDGFHDLETLFQAISLHDTVRFRASTTLMLHCDDPAVPVDEQNLALRAARLMGERFGAPPVEIELIKRIPAGGGLGGGSSNAAATLVALREMFELQVDDDDLAELALELGSDVPYFLFGGTAYATGRGEELAALPFVESIPLLLVLPEERVMTAEAFRLLAAMREKGEAWRSDKAGYEVCREIAASGFRRDVAPLVNDLEMVIFRELPGLATWRDEMVRRGAFWCRMSGSGSTIAAAFETAIARDAAAEAVAGRVRVARAATMSEEESLAWITGSGHDTLEG